MMKAFVPLLERGSTIIINTAPMLAAKRSSPPTRASTLSSR
jgi:hypothetical protein